MGIINKLFGKKRTKPSFEKELKEFLGFKPGNMVIYTAALCHRSVADTPDTNNERLEYLGDAVLGAVIADYLFKRYPYKGEGFLTEMRSKMVNRQMLNEVAIKMGLKKIAQFNRYDHALKSSHIFGNTLEAMIGAVYLDIGYIKTQKWILRHIIIPHLYVDNLESIDINLKNKLIGWANKHGKILTFDTVEERHEKSRRVFTVAVVLDGEVVAKANGFNKKDASQVAAQEAMDKLKLG